MPPSILTVTSNVLPIREATVVRLSQEIDCCGRCGQLLSGCCEHFVRFIKSLST